MPVKHKFPVALSLAIVAGALMAGCGSSSDDPAAATASADGDSVVAQAQRAIQQNTGIPGFTAPGAPIEAHKLAGKSVLVVPSDLVADELAGITKGVQQAGVAAHLNVRVFNPDSAVSAMQQGIRQGIDQRVDAIVVVGIVPSLIRASVKAARAKGIPVIAVENSEPGDGPGQGAGAEYNANAEPLDRTFGELIADTAIAATGGKVNAGILTFNNPIAAAAVAGMKAELAKCSGCKIVATKNIEPENWSTQIASETASLVRSQPDMNYILTSADTMGIFATAGVRQAAAAGKVHVLSVDGSGPATLSLVKKGDVMQADPGALPAWLGWAALDQAMRAMLGKQPAKPSIPYRYLDTKQLASADPAKLSSVYGDSYVTGFKTLWGLGG
jgi:ribose transport system substrate-binding protein